MNYPRTEGKKHRVMPKGMTLVEVIIVISIIAVLAILSIFGISRMRSTARGVTCSTNLRQIGIAMLSYASENYGKLPPLEDRTGTSDGLKAIWPVIIADGGFLSKVTNSKGELGCGAGVWACPDCSIVQRNYNGYGVAEGTVMKVKKGSDTNYSDPRLSSIPNPERTWLVGDTANQAKDLKSGWYAIWASPSQWNSAHAPAPRHGGKVNVCMVDGHMESLTLPQLKAKDYTMLKP